MENTELAENIITCSPGLIQTPEELHATSLGGPSGFLLTWLEMFPEDTPDGT